MSTSPSPSQHRGSAGGIPLTVLREESCGSGCGCGGHGHGTKEGHGSSHEGGHSCSCGSCPRHYHSLAGIILGLYLIAHLTISFLGLWPDRYQSVLNAVHTHRLALVMAEIGFIFIPLAVHIGYGIRFLWREGFTLPNRKHHYGSAGRFFLQRVSAVILLLFIVFHVATMHPAGLHQVYRFTHWTALQRYAIGGLFDPNLAYESTANGIRSFWNVQELGHPGNMVIVAFYLLAVLAAVYHLANGVATAAMVWDVTPDNSPAARRLWHVCLAGGAVLLVLGVGAWYAFTFGAFR